MNKDDDNNSFVYFIEDKLIAQGEELVKKLNENGVYNEVYFSTEFKYNHTFQSTWKGKAAIEANNLFMDFTKRMFNGEI